ncbi:MAG: YciI family protein [Parvularculaceae bacterium]
MKYMLFIYDNEDEWAALDESAQREVIGSHFAYTQALKDAGAYVSGAPLDHSKTGKRVRVSGVQDGPFADGKETLGGYYMIEAKHLDEALDWAARCPGASYGHIEVRPLWNIGE